MKIQLYPPFCLHEIGKRDNNEDSVFPAKEEFEKSNKNLFLVCDGVGGAAKGEVASKIVCQVLSEMLTEKKVILGGDINNAISVAEEKMDAHIQKDIEANGMATTLTLLSFHQKGATVAHLGDSRVYQIRDEEILFKTSDHSFVNELVSKNIITLEEAKNHPKRNIVTRAIGIKGQEAQVKYIDDIVEGDYFFLCSDGITESISDDLLVQLLSDNGMSNEDKLEKIKSICSEKSRDNFSAYLVQVKSIELDTFLEKTNQFILANTRFVSAVLILLLVSSVGMLLLLNSERKNAVNNTLEFSIPNSVVDQKDMAGPKLVDTAEGEDSISGLEKQKLEEEFLNIEALTDSINKAKKVQIDSSDYNN